MQQLGLAGDARAGAMVAQRASAVIGGTVQDLADGVREPFQPLWAKVRAPGARIDPRDVQRFIRIDVPDAGHHPLVQQRGLDGTRSGQPTLERSRPQRQPVRPEFGGVALEFGDILLFEAEERAEADLVDAGGADAAVVNATAAPSAANVRRIRVTWRDPRSSWPACGPSGHPTSHGHPGAAASRAS